MLHQHVKQPMVVLVLLGTFQPPVMQQTTARQRAEQHGNNVTVTTVTTQYNMLHQHVEQPVVVLVLLPTP